LRHPIGTEEMNISFDFYEKINSDFYERISEGNYSSNFQKAWQWIIFTIPYSFSTSRKKEEF